MQITSESVKVGHPDIVSDSIASNIISRILEEETKIGMDINTMPHCGIEVFLGKGLCVVGGEVSTRVYVDIEKTVRQTVLNIGYKDCALGLNGDSMGVFNAIIPQSPDINIGTRADLGKYKEIGAGDQGIIYGFACDETPELLPLPYVLVNTMMRAFENCGNPIFAPDGKGQVTVDYDQNWRPKRVTTVLMSNAIDYRQVPEKYRSSIEDQARQIAFDCLNKWIDKDTKFIFNPTGEWNAVNSCSAADSGVTGRKLVVQLYGGYPGAQLGGGSIVNKTPEKVDCSAAFGARYVAKNIVASGLATKCSVQLAYAIGIAKPISIYVNTFDTGKVTDEKIAAAVNETFDLTPRGMIETFDLLKADIYKRIPRTLFMNKSYLWEKTDRTDELKRAVR
ncbi:MAG: methionine adenosyltransferase [Smithellaceae bacterium]|jgi:S-adenosylmethionine synthetase|nr:methionine adenosyltransferase [Syntrophaceae bacterium]HOF77364.1 methionine adenosyltransferase [Smithellaceae bacterium]MBP8607941.1 methionine adenosyltransferase [Syntrophaceae bacterium]HOM68740.1 methionine adenosyltransferase [Smithellaceae bacterium]HOS08576.1 methionine adenosyltransferase [Smithellaceae bacterium]